jgi:fluoride exporter
MALVHYLWVALGGALGSVVRYWLSDVIARHWDGSFPWGTLVVNMTGSLVIGLAASLTLPDGRWLLPHGVRLFFLVGVLGGYTTFSSFSLQTLTLLQGGEWGRAAFNAIGSLAGCLLAVWIGYLLAVMLNARTS